MVREMLLTTESKLKSFPYPNIAVEETSKSYSHSQIMHFFFLVFFCVTGLHSGNMETFCLLSLIFDA